LDWSETELIDRGARDTRHEPSFRASTRKQTTVTTKADGGQEDKAGPGYPAEPATSVVSRDVNDGALILDGHARRSTVPQCHRARDPHCRPPAQRTSVEQRPHRETTLSREATARFDGFRELLDAAIHTNRLVSELGTKSARRQRRDSLRRIHSRSSHRNPLA